MFETILVPTDGSDCADAALHRAADLAERFDASVAVIHVVDARHLENAPQHDLLERDGHRIVDDAIDRLESAGIGAEGTVVTAPLHEGILEVATELGADLLVMGTHGRTGVRRFLLGSVTEKVVRLSDVPVLAVPAGKPAAITDVLVPTDGSEGAQAAIDPAIALATAYGAGLHAVSVVDTMALGLDGEADRVVGSLEDAAADAVGTVVEAAAAAGLEDVQSAVEYGLPYSAILEYVEDRDIDLVAIGTHGRSGLARYLLGSTTEKLVRTSPVPVLTVRIPGRDEAGSTA